MRVLVQCEGSSGDVLPFVTLGVALNDRGHDVTLFANEAFAGVVEGPGLIFVSSGDENTYRRTIENPDLWHSARGMSVAVESVVANLHETVALVESHVNGDTVLVCSTLGFASRIASERTGAPLVVAHLAPLVFRSNHRIPRTEVLWVNDGSPKWAKAAWWRMIDFLGDRSVGPGLNQVRDLLGLEPVDRVLSEWMMSADQILGLFPDWFAPPQPDWPDSIRLTGFPFFDQPDTHSFDSDLRGWMAAGDPPVVFTAGTGNIHARRFFETAKTVCARLDLRGLFITANHSDVPGELSPGIRHETYAPFSKILPEARALVSHGGIGTIAEGLRAGVPQLVAHVNFDQRDNGSRLDDLGVGTHLPVKKFRTERAAQALSSILITDKSAAAHEVAKRIYPRRSLDAACEAIEEASERT